MQSLSTKDRIKNAAITCFNRDGIANVRLQNLAEEANMSLGNLTYHFRTKEDIGRAVWEQLVQEQKFLLNEFRVLPLFEDIERLLISIFNLQERYTFFYLDTLEVIRAFPDIRVAHQQHIQWQIQQMQMALEFNFARGVMHRSLNMEGFTLELSKQFWDRVDTWKYRCLIQGLPHHDYSSFSKAVWHLFLPVLTDMGLQELRQTIAMITNEA